MTGESTLCTLLSSTRISLEQTDQNKPTQQSEEGNPHNIEVIHSLLEEADLYTRLVILVMVHSGKSVLSLLYLSFGS